MKGIDVSHHQADPAFVPWAGQDFAIARLTWGAEGVDKLGLAHLEAARSAGIGCVMAYHYVKGDSPAVVQADHFLGRVLVVGQELQGVELAIAVDVEDMPAPHPPWHIPTYREVVLAFLARCRQVLPARRCAVYGPGAYLPRLNLPAEVAELHPLWLADWHPPYPVPKPWKEFAIHQHAVIDGLDRNIFDGSEEDWRRTFLPTPLPYDVLGPVVTATTQASGRTGAETFESFDEGPVIK